MPRLLAIIAKQKAKTNKAASESGMCRVGFETIKNARSRQGQTKNLCKILLRHYQTLGC
jgi:hypothetical protein